MPRYTDYEDESIARALRQLYTRAQRDGLGGAEHVEALMRIWGNDPSAVTFPQKATRHFKRGELQRLVLGALRGGPKTSSQLYDLAHSIAPQITRKEAGQKVRAALVLLRRKGAVESYERVWRLAP